MRDGYGRDVYPTDVWKNPLDESETLAYCCPSHYLGVVHRGCISTLGPVTSNTYSQHCVVYAPPGGYTTISTVDGLTYSEGVVSCLEPTGTLAGSTTMVDLGVVVGETGNGFSDIAVATWVPAVPLVYKKSDMVKKEGDSDDSGTRTATATGEGSNENAVPGVPRQGVITVLELTLGVLAGTGMLLSS
ncbi:hypothetical protein FSARC_12310 [Fusarium sarcochroum]|uniref:Uncharacterized protein n=1 Tax=Fusarium sarcochroum TaxID=1208366 RepID=A0A8H4T9N3_9HYPO|nr:hypothetical protein FSARC_12310 [Fusarium sarcochroum]